ncbi:hypothetical protein M407DRAFT_10702 [Tulasnella calospora MUT 4182]|uniref:SH3 domain-containing protein n=1 Tax=Tulasnella calospora MUT 4182 TaxID=1051891 RepID=A0A0C3PZF0_9AGAM|nr:hypothetical protein M407DRAFT_10702 [Tulasnella calospora MUT 4182]
MNRINTSQTGRTPLIPLDILEVQSDFEARTANELTIKEGNILFILSDGVTDGWVLARCVSHIHEDPSKEPSGLVPRSCLRKIPPEWRGRALYEYTAGNENCVRTMGLGQKMDIYARLGECLLVKLDGFDGEAGRTGYVPKLYVEIFDDNDDYCYLCESSSCVPRSVVKGASPSPALLPTFVITDHEKPKLKQVQRLGNGKDPSSKGSFVECLNAVRKVPCKNQTISFQCDAPHRVLNLNIYLIHEVVAMSASEALVEPSTAYWASNSKSLAALTPSDILCSKWDFHAFNESQLTVKQGEIQLPLSYNPGEWAAGHYSIRRSASVLSEPSNLYIKEKMTIYLWRGEWWLVKLDEVRADGGQVGFIHTRYIKVFEEKGKLMLIAEHLISAKNAHIYAKLTSLTRALMAGTICLISGYHRRARRIATDVER